MSSLFKMFSRSLAGLCLGLWLAAAGPALAGAPVVAARVVATLPHDTAAFTQGLLYKDGLLYESTGLYGQSTLRRLDAATGKVLDKRALPSRYFGEGLALAGGRLHQLTWREGRVLLADPASLRSLGELPLPTEGWGVTVLDGALVVSDGSARLTFYDPATMRPVGGVDVTEDGAPVAALNELEIVAGHIWANVWHSPRIAVIEPASGRVVAWVDCTNLARPVTAADPERVLNGIAHDPATGRTWVTGKNWPAIYEITAPGLPQGKGR
ncbi:MAG: glutaminyl-peptide cyclotransferase [Solidesulfovibrio sp.]|uniref:glutaminyl-peptide cyclotransferase n=1 Tax=Solidesulfovibrio sp. TaxID=2910990 RepID=UPI002B1F326E|nr:glutaminyl-peptide cyclotransferase [Solidesulfovibrio sp.]MEA4857161.1 glutaminyl-peptide cyclotransferase [Solidesulfovibrio sp.]